MRLRILAAVLCSGVVVAGCGSDGNQTVPGQPAGNGGAAAPAGGDCPVTADELSSATSLSWKHQQTKKDHPLETLKSVKVTACIYTAAEAPQMGGDPLVARVDVVGAKDADTVRQDFTSSCADLGGQQRAAAGGTVCDRNGTVVEGIIGNLVVVSIANADKATATKLTPSFEKVLAAAS